MNTPSRHVFQTHMSQRYASHAHRVGEFQSCVTQEQMPFTHGSGGESCVSAWWRVWQDTASACIDD